MEKKIYIVISGSYSDHIDAVFSTEELAKQFIERYEADNKRRNYFDIEEWSVDDMLGQDGRFIYTVKWYSNANIEASIDIDNDDQIDTVRREDLNRNTNPYCYCLKIKARDKEHAIKIASERMFFIKANPYLFPYLDDLCVKHRIYEYFSYPAYDFNTCKIVLGKNQEFIHKSNQL